MAFQTGTSTSIENLLQQLSTFLQANGWTEDFAVTGDPGTIAFSKNGIFVSFQYSESAESGAGTMAQYMAKANDTGDTADPWLSTDDSGSGEASNIINNLDGGLCVNNFAGPHTAFFFFENNASPAYIHVVVEVDAGRYRHFGFGEIDKVGDWVGGEYHYGHFVLPGSQSDDPSSSFHGYGADSVRTQGGGDVGAVMRIEGHVGEPEAATIWGTWNGANSNGLDRAGNLRWRFAGGHRYPPEYAAQYWIRASEANAFKPMSPISMFAQNRVGAPDQHYLLGYFADERLVNIGNIDPGQVINIAGEDWYFFPWVRKRNLQDGTEESRNAGIAYRRENA